MVKDLALKPQILWPHRRVWKPQALVLWPCQLCAACRCEGGMPPGLAAG